MLRIRELRARIGLSQEDLADKLNVTHATVQRWEVGKRVMPSSRVCQLAKVLECHPGELFEPLPARVLTPDQAAAVEVAGKLSGDKLDAWLQTGRALAGVEAEKHSRRRRPLPKAS